MLISKHVKRDVGCMIQEFREVWARDKRLVCLYYINGVLSQVNGLDHSKRMFYIIRRKLHPQDDLISQIEQIFQYQVGLA